MNTPSVLKHYWSLQWLRIKRWFESKGIDVVLGISLIAIFFLGSSIMLFHSNSLAPWIDLAAAASFLVGMGDRQRVDLLKQTFSTKQFRQIRLSENLLVALPFTVFLLIQGLYVLTVALLVGASVLSLLSSRLSANKVLPTPFKKLPFEPIVGFRKTFLVLLGILFLIIKAIQVGNYNLGIVSYGATFLTMMSYYSKPEPKFFVWIFDRTSKIFLRSKLFQCLFAAAILTSPMLISLAFAFPSMLKATLAITVLGYFMLGSIIFAKYSAYPSEMSILEGLLYAVGLSFPPLLLIIIPIFYKKSLRNLNPILE